MRQRNDVQGVFACEAVESRRLCSASPSSLLYPAAMSQPIQIAIARLGRHTKATPPPAPISTVLAPTKLTATPLSDSAIGLSWRGSASASNYLIERSPDGHSGWSIIASLGNGATGFTDAALKPATTYSYRVVAVAANGAAATSGIATARTIALPDPFIYGLSTGSAIDRIDTRTGQTQTVGSLMFPSEAGDVSPIDHQVYYVEQNTNSPRLAVWNPITGSNVLLGVLRVDGHVERATFSPTGTLYLTGNNGDLYAVDTTHAAARLLGTIQGVTTSSGDMTFTDANTLYLESYGTLFRVNVNTLSSTLVGRDGPVGNLQLTAGLDGKLYGTDEPGNLYVVNPGNGAVSFVGFTGRTDVRDLASL